MYNLIGCSSLSRYHTLSRLAVAAENNAPEMNATDSVQAELDQPVTFQLIGSDAEDGSSVIYFAAPTSTGNFTLNNISGLVTYQVTPNQTDDLR